VVARGGSREQRPARIVGEAAGSGCSGWSGIPWPRWRHAASVAAHECRMAGSGAILEQVRIEFVVTGMLF
jgi:hypothetical protein